MACAICVSREVLSSSSFDCSEASAGRFFVATASSSVSRSSICCIRNWLGIAVLVSKATSTPCRERMWLARCTGLLRVRYASLTRVVHCSDARRSASPACAKRSGCTWDWMSRYAFSSTSLSRPKAGASPNNSKWLCKPLDVKALAAPALILDLRVAELEALVEALAGVVELGAVDVLQA